MDNTAGVQEGLKDKWLRPLDEQAVERRQEQKEVFDRYRIEIPPEVAAGFDRVIAGSSNPEDTAYRIGTALRYAEMIPDMSFEEAYARQDELNRAYFGGGSRDAKGNFEAVCDAWRTGNLSLRQGDLGMEIMNAEAAGDEEALKVYTAELEAINAELAELEDTVPRGLLTEAFKNGLMSAPFTLRSAGTGIAVGLLNPALGSFASFMCSSAQMAGQEYLKLREEGASPEAASKAAAISGALQGLVETSLGDVAGFAGAGLKAAGRALGRNAVKNIAQGAAKRFALGGGVRLAGHIAGRYALEVGTEGLEEAVQELVSIATSSITAEIEGYDFEKPKADEIIRSVSEAFRGGILGSLVLSGVPMAVNTTVSIADYRAVRQTAVETDSEEAFRKSVEDSPVFSVYEGRKKEDAIRNVWESYRRQREERNTREAQDLGEVTGASEGMEGNATDAETGDITAAGDEYREDGRLFTQNDVTEDGGSFRTGNPEKESENLYGYINYRLDGSGNRVEITDFKMTASREALREEFYDSFAEEFAGYDIVWNPKGKTARDIKARIEKASPSGQGLNYYTSVESVADAKTRTRVAAELKKYMPRLDDRQRAGAVSLLEAMAAGQGKNISTYVHDSFGASIFGRTEEAESLAQAQGDTFRGKAGATSWREFGDQVKAVIYAGEKADFSTWAHELAHVYQRQLEGEMKAQAESAFNVKDGDWTGSTYTFSDGRSMSSAEAFAYGFQDWLETGKAPNEQMKGLFERFAEFLARCYNALKNHFQLSDEVRQTYEKMLAGDGSLLAKAEEAVRRQNMEQRARERTEAVREAETSRRTEEAKAVETAETTVQEAQEEERAPAPEAEPAEDTRTEEARAAMPETPGAEALAEAITSLDTTVEEKNGAVMEGAGTERAFEDMLFQLAGLKGVKQIARAEEKQKRLFNLKTAVMMEEKFRKQGLPEDVAVRRIKRDTNWERNASGQWVYETDDSAARIRNRAQLDGFLRKARAGHPQQTMLIGEVLDHPELFEMYPWLRDLNVIFFNDKTPFRSGIGEHGILLNTRYLTGTDGETGIKGSLLHEMQHIVQSFEVNGNVEIDVNNIRSLWEGLQALVAGRNTPATDEVLGESLGEYIRDPEEVDARNVAMRLAYNADRRRNTPLPVSAQEYEERKSSRGILFQNTEEDEVRMKYAGSDSWMKAPNGKDTKLTEKQWLQVRTPSFKAWFGDWEGDPESASKAVDENGEPLVVYHATDGDFWTFNSERLGKNTLDNASDEGLAATSLLGHWFNTQDLTQRKYPIGSRPIPAFLNIRTPDYAGSLDLLASDLEGYDSPKEAADDYLDRITDNDGIILRDTEFGGTSFVVFTSNQIKSATDNAGTFDPRNPSILFQIIGLSGASGLDLREDSADRAYLRQYNLTTAQEMEAAGKDAKAIRLATGWEKGADGKWKYEIPDGKLTGAQLRDEGGVLTAKLGELYDAPELYRAYPELRDVTVRLFEKDYSKRGFVWGGEIGLSGIFLQRGNLEEIARAEARIREIEESAEWKELMRKIFEDTGITDGELRRAEDEFYASPMGQERDRLYDELAEKEGFYLKPEALPTLVHEIQHMIQDREGFAKGGNPETVKGFIFGSEEERFAAAVTEDIKYTRRKFKTSLEGAFRITRDLADEMHADGSMDPDRYKGILYIAGELEKGRSLKEVIAGLERKAGRLREDPFELYRILAGETEARTAAARIGLGAEARRGTLLSETADVSPEDQLILFQQAYHGSPYGFDSFSTDAIGSGEGRQVFGWGLYFTDNRGIAEGYAKKLTKPKVRYKGEDTETAKRRAKDLRTAEEIEAGEESTEESMLGFIERMARNKASGLTDYKENIKELIKVRENILEGKGYPPNETQKRIYRKQIEALRNIDPEQIEVFPVPRNLYTVDIPDGDYIKWDGLLTEGQKRKIAEQARKEGITDRWGNPFAYEMDGEWVPNSGATSSGEVFYRMEMQGYFPDDKAKSLFLARAGIKGIDYPAGSLSGGADGRNFVVFDAADVQVQEHILFQMEAIDDEQLREAISSVPHTEARKQYIKEIYENQKNGYETREFVSRDGKRKGNLEVYRQRSLKGKEHEIDEALFFASKGIDVTLLAEGTVHEGKSVDALFNHDTLVEFKRVTSATANGVANNIKDAANKMNSEVITVFFADQAEDVGYEDILKRLEAKQQKGDIKGSFDRLIFVKDGEISLLKQNTASPAFASTYRNPNIAQDSGDVNRNLAEDLLFQTEKELLDDAASFDSWQDFMEFYESFGKPEDSIVPSGADEAWYRTAWELARKRKADRETGMTAEDRDALFIREMEDGGLEDFLTEADRVERAELWQPSTEEETAEIESLSELKDRVRTVMAHGSWLSNARRVADGKELTPSTRKRLMTLLKEGARDYRALYAELSGREDLAVGEGETVAAGIRKKYRLADPDGSLERRSPEERRRIAAELENRDVAERIRSGEMPMDGELQRYIDSLEKETRKAERAYRKLKAETQEDWERISGWESRQLLKEHEKLLEAQEKSGGMTAEIRRKAERGIRITERERREADRLKASYETVFRKFEALRRSISITEEVRGAIGRREDLLRLREEFRAKEREKRLLEEEKRIRTSLVKRAMRKVDFGTVDYSKGRIISAIQQLFEPNLTGGVNRWLGTEGAGLRETAVRWKTDAEWKEGQERILSRRRNGQAVIAVLNDKPYEKWTKGDREAVWRAFPRTDWVKELDLEGLAEGRMRIDFTERTEERVNPDGSRETRTELVPDPELEAEIREALGDGLYSMLAGRPFAEWTTAEMEQFAVRINGLFSEGREELLAKNLLRRQRADRLRREIDRVLQDTGVVINPDDPEPVKERKRRKIARILGEDPSLKGTAAGAERKDRGRVNRLVNGYGAARLRSVTRILDGWKDGVNTRELYFRENEAYNSEMRSAMARKKKVAQVLEEQKISMRELFRKVEIPGLINGQSVSFTVDELLFFREAAKDERSRAAVAYGNIGSSELFLDLKMRCAAMDENNPRRPGTKLFREVCDGALDKILEAADRLDMKYMKLAEAIAGDYAEQYERMNRVSIEEWNRPVNRVDNYVPLVRLESNGDTNENRVREDLLGINGMGQSGVDRGMTKSRIDISPLHQKPVETGLYKTWADSVDRTEHFIAYSGYVRELNRVYRSRDAQLLRQRIEGRYGRNMLRYIDGYIDETANPGAVGTASDLDRIIRTLRGKTAPAYLSWKLSTILKQMVTSPPPFFQFVSPVQYMAALFDIIRSKGGLLGAVREKSVFMESRVMDPMNELVDEQLEKARSLPSWLVGRANKLGMKGLEMADWVCVAPGWLACYRKKLAELEQSKAARYGKIKAELEEANGGLGYGDPGFMTADMIEAEAGRILEEDTERQAVDWADDCVRMCQPSARGADIAPLFKGRQAGSELAKAFLQFQTALNVIWNNIRYDIPYAVRNRNFMSAISIIGAYTVAGILVGALAEGLPDDDEDKDALKQLVFFGTTQFTDAVPVIGSELTNLMRKGITGESGFFRNGTDLTPMAGKFIQAAQNISAGDWEKALARAAEGAALFTGLPVSGAKELTYVLTGEPGISALWGRRE